VTEKYTHPRENDLKSTYRGVRNNLGFTAERTCRSAEFLV